MSVTSGFFNSLNGDRRYNAEQMSSLFNGIINDGVFANIGDGFTVKSVGSNNITVGLGRAWFNSAWLLNDSILPLQAEIPELVLDRYDAVVIEINHTDEVRSGLIKIVKGDPSSDPVYPEMVHTQYVHQYPLAYIRRIANANAIDQADITNMVGTSSCPYITGILEVHNIDKIVAQWEAQWNQWFAVNTANAGSEMNQWMVEFKTEVDTWFSLLTNSLEGEVAVQLANQIIEIQNRLSDLHDEQTIYDTVKDSNGNAILDSYNTPIKSKNVFATMDDLSKTNENLSKTNQELKELANKKSSTGITITLSKSNWVNKSGSIYYEANPTLVTSVNNIIVSPNPSSHTEYVECGIRATEQGDNYLKFVAESAPQNNIDVNILIFK